MKYGADGYALYWLCLELIAEPIDKDNINFELEHDAEILAHRLKIDSTHIEEIMRYMVQLELFETNVTNNRITCLKLAKRLENSIIKNPQLREIQSKICDQNPGKSGTTQENPGNSRLDKNRLEENKDIRAFVVFWEAWPKKKDKKKAEKVFVKINPSEELLQVMLDALEKQKQTEDWKKEGGRFIPLPTTWLNGARWEDEITERQPEVSEIDLVNMSS